MATVAILRPALHKIIHRYGRLSTHAFQEEQDWVSGDETEDEDHFSVYSDEYISQEEYSEEEAEEEYTTVKHYTVNMCTNGRSSKRRKF